MALFVDLVALSNGLHGSVQMDLAALFSWIGWLRHRGILKINLYNLFYACKVSYVSPSMWCDFLLLYHSTWLQALSSIFLNKFFITIKFHPSLFKWFCMQLLLNKYNHKPIIFICIINSNTLTNKPYILL